VILDQNGKPVPDGTPVEFVVTQGTQESSTRQIAYTQGGVARTTVMVGQSGPLQVIATSDRAQSTTMRFNIPPLNGEVPPPTPTETPTPTPEPTPSPTVTVVLVAAPEPTLPSRPQLADWAMALLVTCVIAWSSYRMAAMAGQVRWGVRGGFLALIGGLAAYSYLALQMPGTEGLLNNSVSRGVFISTLLGSVIGLLAAWFWRAAAGANGKDRTAYKTITQVRNKMIGVVVDCSEIQNNPDHPPYPRLTINRGPETYRKRVATRLKSKIEAERKIKTRSTGEDTRSARVGVGRGARGRMEGSQSPRSACRKASISCGRSSG
jgi:hypothetical protein